jgi:hypothetical protein
MRAVSGASALVLTAVPALAAWAAWRAHTGRSVAGQVLGQPVALAAAIFGLFWLAGGTSC